MFTSWALLVLSSCIFYQLFAKFALTSGVARCVFLRPISMAFTHFAWLIGCSWCFRPFLAQLPLAMGSISTKGCLNIAASDLYFIRNKYYLILRSPPIIFPKSFSFLDLVHTSEVWKPRSGSTIMTLTYNYTQLHRGGSVPGHRPYALFHTGGEGNHSRGMSKYRTTSSSIQGALNDQHRGAPYAEPILYRLCWPVAQTHFLVPA